MSDEPGNTLGTHYITVTAKGKKETYLEQRQNKLTPGNFIDIAHYEQCKELTKPNTTCHMFCDRQNHSEFIKTRKN
jgi:hypothetical protein